MPSTRRVYDTIRQQYISFCQEHDYSPYPSSFRAASHWIAHLMHSVKPSTAKRYIGALRSLHVQAGFDTTGIDDNHIPLILCGGKRIYVEGAKAIRYPLTSDNLCRVVCEIDDSEEGTNLKAAFCVAFAAFLRSGEFTWDTWSSDSHLSHLSHKHVVFHPSSVTLTLPSSRQINFEPVQKSILRIRLVPCSDPSLHSVLFRRYHASSFFPCSRDLSINHLAKHSLFLRCINCF
jgi:hypothetical protein